LTERDGTGKVRPDRGEYTEPESEAVEMRTTSCLVVAFLTLHLGAVAAGPEDEAARLRKDLERLQKQVDALTKQVELLQKAAKPADTSDPFDPLEAARERAKIEEQKVTEQVQSLLRKAKARQEDEPEAAAKLLREALLLVWDHPELNERVKETLLDRVLAARRGLGKK
jgi:hypothetical protein